MTTKDQFWGKDEEKEHFGGILSKRIAIGHENFHNDINPWYIVREL